MKRSQPYARWKTVGSSSTLAFDRGLLEEKCIVAIGEILGVDEDQLTGLCRSIFGLRSMNNFQKTLAWQYYRGAMPVRDKLYKDESAVSRVCPRCAQSDENSSVCPHPVP